MPKDGKTGGRFLVETGEDIPALRLEVFFLIAHVRMSLKEGYDAVAEGGLHCCRLPATTSVPAVAAASCRSANGPVLLRAAISFFVLRAPSLMEGRSQNLCIGPDLNFTQLTEAKTITIPEIPQRSRSEHYFLERARTVGCV